MRTTYPSGLNKGFQNEYNRYLKKAREYKSSNMSIPSKISFLAQMGKHTTIIIDPIDTTMQAAFTDS